MSDIEEKRVYSEKDDRAVAYVASAAGVVRVTVSGAQIGRFGVVHRCTAADVACDGERAAVAADDDAYLAGADDEFAAAGFGPAAAVGFVDGALVAGAAGAADANAPNGDGGAGARDAPAPDDGRVARYDADADEWETLGETGGVRAVGGGAVAAADGVYLAGDGLRHVGLSDVRDVTADGDGVPLAATGDGLYRLGNGWMDELPGAFRAVAADGDRIHAVSDDGEVFVRGRGDGERGGDADGDGGAWARVDLPADDPAADVAHTAATTLVVTAAGTLLAERESDWRAQALGLTGVAGLAVRG